ncbi:MAG: GDSL-type esterase/lipase family protein [Pseudonocardia sp.]|nr:GDSL-type esterase/lipase family protein [Pseudonocardia sp.]
MAHSTRTRPRHVRALFRELRSLPTIALLIACLFVGLPLAAAATPDRHVRIAGQDIAVGARIPRPTLSGPAQLVQLGNTRFDIPAIQVYGPLRPQLSLGPLQRNDAAAAAVATDSRAATGSAALRTLVNGFVIWYLWATVAVVLFAVAATALVGCMRILIAVHRQTCDTGAAGGLTDLGPRLSGTIARMAVIAVTVSLAGWAASGVAAYRGTTEGLQTIGSLSDLVGTSDITPAPVGPPVFGYSGAVIGDSRVARVGGPPPDDPSGDDTACERSADSPAAELSRIRGEQVLNLACSGASIPAGLRGPQPRGDSELAPQVGRLKQVQGLDWVVVAVGPNDLNWSDFLLYCYGLPSCDDQLAAGEFDLRMAQFDRDWAALLADLDELPGDPRIVITASYDAFVASPATDCPDLRGPAGTPGLDQAKVDLLADRNAQLNEVLETGAQRYGFTVARPALTPLCGDPALRLGPDLQGLADRHPFHPTAAGSLRVAASLANALGPTPPP